MIIDSLVFDELSFDYDDAHPVFARVNFTWPDSSTLWVRAEKDRGRSTLLKLLAGLVEPTAGHVLLNGRPAGAMPFAERLRYRLATGYGFDHGGLLSNQTLAENLALPLTYHGVCPEAEARPTVHALLERFGLGEVAGERPFAVTGSERKLTCVLRAFVHAPELVVLDEPMAGLKRDAIDNLIDFTREAFAYRGLRRLVITGDSPLMADALSAVPLHITRDRFWTGAPK